MRIHLHHSGSVQVSSGLKAASTAFRFWPQDSCSTSACEAISESLKCQDMSRRSKFQLLALKCIEGSPARTASEAFQSIIVIIQRKTNTNDNERRDQKCRTITLKHHHKTIMTWVYVYLYTYIYICIHMIYALCARYILICSSIIKYSKI